MKALVLFKLSFYTIFFFLVAISLINFKLWSQVELLNESGVVLSEVYNHPHFLRYLITLPFFVISEKLNLSYNYLFSIVVPVFLFFIVKYTSNSFEMLCQSRRRIAGNISYLIIMVILTAILLLMNGRIIFSILASALLMLTFFKWESYSTIRVYGHFIISLLLSSVSSGTFTIALVFIVVFLIYQFSKSIKNNFIRVLPLLILLIYIYPIFLKLLLKNLDYYGGGFDGFILMLTHGLGKVFLYMDMFTLSMAFWILILNLIFFVVLIKNFKELTIPLSMVAISLVGGLFGISTMMMIPALFVIVVYLLRFLHVKKNSRCNLRWGTCKYATTGDKELNGDSQY